MASLQDTQYKEGSEMRGVPNNTIKYRIELTRGNDLDGFSYLRSMIVAGRFGRVARHGIAPLHEVL